MAQRKEEPEKPNYYAVIPASVRYDSKLPKGAILLYGEITALSHKDGTSWATNSYFARLYNVDSSTVQRWLTALEKRHYIRRKVVYKADQKTVEQRLIQALILPEDPTLKMRSGGNEDVKPTVSSDKPIPHLKNKATPSPQKRGHPHRKNEGENNTSINNKNPVSESVKTVIQYLNQKSGHTYRANTWQDVINARLKEGYTVQDMKTVVDNMVSKWTGTDYAQYLAPSTLFPNAKKIEKYRAMTPTRVVPHSEPPAQNNPQDILREYAKKQAALYVGLSAEDVAAKVVHDWTQGDIKPDPQQVLATVQEYRKAGKTNETH